MLVFLLLSSAFASISICEKGVVSPMSTWQSLTFTGQRWQSPYLFHIRDFRLSPPDEVKQGQIITLSVNYTSPILIDAGTSMTTIRYRGLPLPALKQSICELTSCPIQPGTNNFTYTFQYPYGFPGSTTTSIMWYDANATVFFCLKIILRSISATHH